MLARKLRMIQNRQYLTTYCTTLTFAILRVPKTAQSLREVAKQVFTSKGYTPDVIFFHYVVDDIEIVPSATILIGLLLL